MEHPPQGFEAADGELVSAHDMPTALTAATLDFPDGATQTFMTEGHKTTYVDNGRPTDGEWAVLGDGEFSSFWPPNYRATYVLRWIVEDGARVGVSFTDTLSKRRFDGRYR